MRKMVVRTLSLSSIAGAVAFPLTFICVFASPSVARADIDLQMAMGTNVGWVRTTPTLVMNEALSTAAREMAEGTKVPARGGIAMFGGYLEGIVTVGDRWLVPLVGAGIYTAVGSYDAVTTTLDGSVAELKPWTAYRVDLLLPGIGYRIKHRRMMASFSVRTGFSAINMDGAVAAGAESAPFIAHATTLLLQAELEGCRRLDPVTRICIQLAPRLYDHGILNGATLGLRLEWGR